MSKAVVILHQIRDENAAEVVRLNGIIGDLESQLEDRRGEREQAEHEVTALDTAINALGGIQKTGFLRRGGKA